MSLWEYLCLFPLVYIIITVEPQLSGPPLSGTSIIRFGIKFLFTINSENGRVPEMRMHIAAVTMETARSAYLLRMRRQPCGTAVYQ